MENKTWTWILLIIVVILLFTALGVIYWTSFKVKKVADSALNAAKNEESIVTPTSSPSNNQTPQPTLSMPAADVEGADLVDVPRSSGAIMSLYEKNDEGTVTNLEYFVRANSNDILEFYKSTLLSKDWLLRAADNKALNFSKPDAEVSIEIVDEDKSANITQYQIHWFKIQEEST